MRFILGLLVGYCIRGKQRLLIGTLTAIAIVVFIVLPRNHSFTTCHIS